MNLANEAQSILKTLGGAARRKLGQNFMVRESDLSFIADAAGLVEGETVLEVGPGLGFLTRFLLQKKAQVLAVEKDRLYAEFLKDHFQGSAFRLVEADILEVDLKKDLKISKPVKVIGNIPYNITSPLLEWLIQNRSLVTSAVLTTQWEVAERLAAESGTKSWGVLSIFLRLYADVSLLKKIGPDSFYPPPKVNSAVIRIQFLDKPKYDISDEEKFFRLIRRAFQKRRKTILNALADETVQELSKSSLSAALSQCDVNPIRRPETLTIGEWVNLSQHFPPLF